MTNKLFNTYKVALRHNVRGISEHTSYEEAIKAKNKAGSKYHIYRFGSLSSIEKPKIDKWMMWKR